MRFSPRPCPLCAAPLLSVYHLLCECPDSHWVQTRRLYALACTSLIGYVASACLNAMEAEREDSSRPYRDELAISLAAVLDPSLSTDEHRFLAYWLLCATPWPYFAVPPSFVVANALGVIFKATHVQHRFLRPLASSWLGWSEAWVHAIAQTWRASTAAAAAFRSPSV